jgi:uncharacterized membrane protein YjjP (DUF1212 family)
VEITGHDGRRGPPGGPTDEEVAAVPFGARPRVRRTGPGPADDRPDQVDGGAATPPERTSDSAKPTANPTANPAAKPNGSAGGARRSGPWPNFRPRIDRVEQWWGRERRRWQLPTRPGVGHLPQPGAGPTAESAVVPTAEPTAEPSAPVRLELVEHGPELPDDGTVNLVLDLALRIGEILMASGAGASDVTFTMLALTESFGLHCEVDVIFTSISVCCHRGVERSPVTAQRVVRSRSLDYTRLIDLERLVHRITTHQLTAGEARTELARIYAAPHPYPRWVATAAWALMAAAIVVLLGGGATISVAAALITALIDRVGRLLNRRNLPFFFQQVVGGGLATGITLSLMHLGLLPPGVQPAVVVAGAITVLLSGLSVVSTVQDAISGFNVTAAGRAMEVTMMSAGLVTGVVLALFVAVRFGLPSAPLAAALPPTALQLPAQVIAGAAASAAFGLACYATRRALLVAAGAGALGAAVHSALALGGVNSIVATAVAAVAIGFAGGTISRRLRIPPLVVAVSGLTPLLPGLTTYRSMFQLAVQHSLDGIPTLMLAIGTGLALAAGVVLGEYLAQPVRTGLSRLERRLAGPRLAGPIHPGHRRWE